MKETAHSINLYTYIESIFLVLSGAYLVFLRMTNGLTYYIRPDYFMFTLVMGIILMAAGLLNISLFATTPRPINYTWSLKTYDLLKLLFITGVIVVGVLIPKQGLSSQTALRRGTTATFLSGQQASQGIKRDLRSLTVSPLTGKSISNNYSIADWMGVFQLDPEPNDYIGKPVDVIGFVQPQQDGTYQITRFVISCCIADALPISLPVDAQLKGLKANDWIQVKGTFEVKTIKGVRQDVIKPDSVEKVSQPGDPYLY